MRPHKNEKEKTFLIHSAGHLDLILGLPWFVLIISEGPCWSEASSPLRSAKFSCRKLANSKNHCAASPTTRFPFRKRRRNDRGRRSREGNGWVFEGWAVPRGSRPRPSGRGCNVWNRRLPPSASVRREPTFRKKKVWNGSGGLRT